MKKLSLTLIGLVFANSILARGAISPSLVELNNFKIQNRGKILRLNEGRMFPQTAIIGIPVSINLPSACTSFAGQVEKSIPGPLPLNRVNIVPPVQYKKIEILGAINPLPQACIQVVPAPVEVNLTTTVSVPSGIETASQIISISGSFYMVTVNFKHNEVHINRVFFAQAAQR